MARNAMYINKKTGPKSRVEVRAGHEASTHTAAKVQIYFQITNKTWKNYRFLQKLAFRLAQGARHQEGGATV